MHLNISPRHEQSNGTMLFGFPLFVGVLNPLLLKNNKVSEAAIGFHGTETKAVAALLIRNLADSH